MSKMVENKLIKESAMKAKPMYATKMNEQRILLYKKRGIKGGNPLRPRGDIKDRLLVLILLDLGIKKGKMIKARGGRLARVKPTKMM